MHPSGTYEMMQLSLQRLKRLGKKARKCLKSQWRGKSLKSLSENRRFFLWDEEIRIAYLLKMETFNCYSVLTCIKLKSKKQVV